jgi:hypothetical protein
MLLLLLLLLACGVCCGRNCTSVEWLETDIVRHEQQERSTIMQGTEDISKNLMEMIAREGRVCKQDIVLLQPHAATQPHTPRNGVRIWLLLSG